MWQRLVGESRRAAEWLGGEMEQVFTTEIQGIGGDSVNGETRGSLVEARDRVRACLLTRSLEQHRPRKDRQAWAWKQRDKLSSAWLLALPGGSDSLSNEEFTTAAATNLCLPQPVCVERLGELIKGRVTIDQHGDNIQSSALPGDHWRKRHDDMKIMLYRLCLWAGLPVDMEVFNLFSRFIPQEGLARIESHRQRKGLIPDLKIVFPAHRSSQGVIVQPRSIVTTSPLADFAVIFFFNICVFPINCIFLAIKVMHHTHTFRFDTPAC